MKLVREMCLKHMKIATRELERTPLNKSPMAIGLLPFRKITFRMCSKMKR